MDYKKEIQNLLEFLKKLGHSRNEIETKLGLASNSITQTLSRNGSERMYREILLFKEWAVLNNSTSKGQAEEPVPVYGDPMSRLLVQQNRLIDSMNQQSTTANKILVRLADNVETKVESIDLSLADALARIESLTINVTSGRSVILKSLARLEKKPEQTLQKEADSINASLLQELSGKQSKKSGKGR